MSALYVEPEGTGWSRPNQIPQGDAEKFVRDAINDYRVILRGNPESKLNKSRQLGNMHPFS